MIKKIVFLGGEDVSARIDISKRLIKVGYEIEIIGSEDAGLFVENNIKYTKLILNREFNITDDLKTIVTLRTLLKQFSEDVIVHAFDTKLTMFLPIASIGLKKIRVVRTINGMGRIFTAQNVTNSFLSLLYKLIHKSVKNNVDFTIFQNSDNFKYFVKKGLVGKANSVVISSSGINLGDYSEIVEESVKEDLKSKYIKYKLSPTFILVSRMIKQKGISNFLEAAKLFYSNGYRANFLLVGQLDSNKDSLALEYIDSYSEYVNYLGKQTNIKELLSISDIFVLPTYYSEGVPRVLLEASAMSLALLTTNMPGCNDVLIDGFNGFTVEVNDTKDLYFKMSSLVENLDELNRMKINALKHVDKFSLEKVTLQCHDVYSKVSAVK
jgi:glycosyltransferase involved in cell wall biosynthesis